MSVKLKTRNLKNGKKSLYLDIQQNGERVYKFLKIYLDDDKQQNKERYKLANLIRAETERELIITNNNLKDLKKNELSVFTYLKTEIENRKSDKPTWITVQNKLINFTGGKLKFSQINNGWLIEFKKFLISEISQNTAHHYFGIFKSVLNKAYKEGLLFANQYKHVPNFPILEVKREYLTLEEIDMLAKTHCVNNEVKKAFLFACFTGLRRSDIINLTWENIKDDKIEYKQRKTQKFEYLYLHNNAKEIINSLLHQGILNFPNKKIFTLPTTEWMGKLIKDWVREAGINKNITFHSSRHTFATLSLTSGVDIFTVSKLLGHKNISTTQIYAKIIDQKKKEAINMIPSINFIF